MHIPLSAWDSPDNLAPHVTSVSDLDRFSYKGEIRDLVIRTTHDFKRAVCHVAEQVFNDGVTYFELRFNPYKKSAFEDLEGKNDEEIIKITLKSAIEGLLEAEKAANKGLGGKHHARIIFSFNRGKYLLNLQELERILKIVFEVMNNGRNKKLVRRIIGIDLSGPSENETWRFSKILRQAKEMGLLTTAHLGERFKSRGEYECMEDILGNVELIIDDLDRIGHSLALSPLPKGLLGKKDKKGGIYTQERINGINRRIRLLWEKIKGRKLIIECCPSTNLRSRLINDYRNHPFHFWEKKNFNLSVGIDGLWFWPARLSEEVTRLLLSSPNKISFQKMQKFVCAFSTSCNGNVVDVSTPATAQKNGASSPLIYERWGRDASMLQARMPYFDPLTGKIKQRKMITGVSFDDDSCGLQRVGIEYDGLGQVDKVEVHWWYKPSPETFRPIRIRLDDARIFAFEFFEDGAPRISIRFAPRREWVFSGYIYDERHYDYATSYGDTHYVTVSHYADGVWASETFDHEMMLDFARQVISRRRLSWKKVALRNWDLHHDVYLAVGPQSSNWMAYVKVNCVAGCAQWIYPSWYTPSGHTLHGAQYSWLRGSGMPAIDYIGGQIIPEKQFFLESFDFDYFSSVDPVNPHNASAREISAEVGRIVNAEDSNNKRVIGLNFNRSHAGRVEIDYSPREKGNFILNCLVDGFALTHGPVTLKRVNLGDRFDVRLKRNVRLAAHSILPAAALALSESEEAKKEVASSPVTVLYHLSSMPERAKNLYSLHKLGDMQAIEFFAASLQEIISQQIGNQIADNPDGWLLVSGPNAALKNNAFYLGWTIAKKLGIKQINIKRKIYGGNVLYVDCSPERKVQIARQTLFYEDGMPLKNKHIIFIDDIFASGTICKTVTGILLKNGARRVLAYVVVELDKQGTFEMELDKAALKVRGIETIVGILNCPCNVITSRMITVLSQCKPAEIKHLVDNLNAQRLFELRGMVNKYFEHGLCPKLFTPLLNYNFGVITTDTSSALTGSQSHKSQVTSLPAAAASQKSASSPLIADHIISWKDRSHHERLLKCAVMKNSGSVAFLCNFNNAGSLDRLATAIYTANIAKFLTRAQGLVISVRCLWGIPRPIRTRAVILTSDAITDFPQFTADLSEYLKKIGLKRISPFGGELAELKNGKITYDFCAGIMLSHLIKYFDTTVYPQLCLQEISNYQLCIDRPLKLGVYAIRSSKVASSPANLQIKIIGKNDSPQRTIVLTENGREIGWLVVRLFSSNKELWIEYIKLRRGVKINGLLLYFGLLKALREGELQGYSITRCFVINPKIAYILVNRGWGPVKRMDTQRIVVGKRVSHNAPMLVWVAGSWWRRFKVRSLFTILGIKGVRLTSDFPQGGRDLYICCEYVAPDPWFSKRPSFQNYTNSPATTAQKEGASSPLGSSSPIARASGFPADSQIAGSSPVELDTLVYPLWRMLVEGREQEFLDAVRRLKSEEQGYLLYAAVIPDDVFKYVEWSPSSFVLAERVLVIIEGILEKSHNIVLPDPVHCGLRVTFENVIQHVPSVGGKGALLLFNPGDGPHIYLIDSGPGMPVGRALAGQYKDENSEHGLALQSMSVYSGIYPDNFTFVSRNRQWNSRIKVEIPTQLPTPETRGVLFKIEPASSPAQNSGTPNVPIEEHLKNQSEGRPYLPRGPPGINAKKLLHRLMLLILLICSPLHGQNYNFLGIRDDNLLVNEFIREGKEAIERGDIPKGEKKFFAAFKLMPEKVALLRKVSKEVRGIMIDAYLESEVNRFNGISIKPHGRLLAAGVTQDELRDSCKKLLTHFNFIVAIEAAMALAKTGDYAGRDVLIDAANGDFESRLQYDGVNYDDAAAQMKEHLVVAATFLLADSGDSAAISVLIRILQDTMGHKPEVRAYAAYCLSKFRDESMITPLKDAATDSDKRVRAAAIFALGNFQDPELFDIFAAALKANNRDVVNEAITAMGKLEDPRLVKLFDEVLIHKKDKDTKLRIVFALAQIDGDEAFSLLGRLAKDGNADVRAAAISVLSKFDNPEAKKIFVAALKDSAAAVRVQGALALSAYLSDDLMLAETVVTLFNKERDDAARAAYIRSLSAVQGEEVKGFLTGIVSGKYNEQVRAEALAALADRVKSDVDVFGIMQERLRDGSKVVASVAVVALAPHIETYPQVEDAVREALAKSDLNTRLGILSGLSVSGSFKAVQIIWPHIMSTDPAMKNGALMALGRTGRPEALPALTWAAGNPGPEIKQIAAIALGALGSPEGLPVLRGLMTHEDPKVYGAAMEGFARIPGAPVAELRPFLRNDRSEIRFNAARILGPTAVNDAGIAWDLVSLAEQEDNILVRSMATLGLGGVKSANALNACLLNTRSRDWLLRQSATASLGKIDINYDAIAPLVSLLRDPSHFVRQEALLGLQGRVTKNPAIVGAAQPLLTDPYWQVRQEAVRVVSKGSDFKSIESIIPRLQDNSAAVRQAARLGLAEKLTENQKLIATYPVLKELEPWIKEYQSKPGAIVVVFEGWDDLNPLTSIRNPGWSNGLLLKDTINLISKLSGGKIEFREGNWSGNTVFNNQDIGPVAAFLYEAWNDARKSNRGFYVIGNSYANKIIPVAFETAQRVHENLKIKADLYVGTGNPGWEMLGSIEALRKISVSKPVIIGSYSDFFISVMPHLPRGSRADYCFLPDVRHNGPQGYFNHPVSVSVIMNKIGLATPILPNVNLYTDVLSLSRLRIENRMPRIDNISSYGAAPFNNTLKNYSWQQITQPNAPLNPRIDYSSTFGWKAVPTVPNIFVPNFQQPAFRPLPDRIQVTPYRSYVPTPIHTPNVYTPPINITPPAPINIPIPNFPRR
ncbi:MAG: HEAT repeat domain-containing protein [Candidatus Omnitrophica bacterium]|nr:HEAT repeat domain-containing protein [Candidatus Omnitrophota bacterium]